MRNNFALHRKTALATLLASAVAVGAGSWAWYRNPSRGLPFRADFNASSMEHWTAYSGAWESVNGSMRSDSNDRGAKLLTGSPYWSDYTMDADIQLLGPGDAGLLARVRDPETGVDSYSGYYAGLRTNDNMLVLGRAQYGWDEFPAERMPGGVHPFHWYHLHFSIVGCTVSATATAYGTGEAASNSHHLNECQKAGEIGLRSYYSGGIWRNVVVRPISQPASAREQMSASLPPPESEFGRRGLMVDYIASGRDVPESRLLESKRVQSIASLRFESQLGTSIGTIRGLVVLTAPRLYVQDSTAGVAVRVAAGPPLKIGDEIEATGVIRSHSFQTVLEEAKVRLLWQANAAPPLSVTANQAASGVYDAMFVQVEGVLSRKWTQADGTIGLALDSGPQSFRALLAPGRITSRLPQLRLGATLRLKGVCAVGSEFTANTTPFALLVRSAEDMQVIAAPPWWRLSRLIPFGIAALLVLAVAGQVYVFAKHWRLRAVLEERGRLAHEIHDTLAQSFAGIGFQLRAVRKNLPEDNPTLQEQLDLACDMVRHSHEEARRSISTLRPENLEGTGLEIALRDCGRRMTQSGPVVIRSVAAGNAIPIPLRIKDTLFRIGQEAIANAIRHSEAKCIEIQVHYLIEAVTLIVSDDGKGFEAMETHSGFGLVGMGKRARAVSAAMSIRSAPGGGTTVEVTAPLPATLTFRTWPRYLVQLYRNGNGTLQKDPYSYRG